MNHTEAQEIAERALLDVAQDKTIRAALRIHAARSVLFGALEFDESPEEEPEDAATAARHESEEDLIDRIAERVAAKLKETS